MRKLVVGVLMGTLMLVAAAVSMAASAQSGNTVQNYDQNYSSKKPKTSVGTTFSTSSSDETNTAKNRQPKRVTNFDITFPKGTKIDTKAIAQCKADEQDFAQAESPDDACPKNSKIGTGEVAARTPFNGIADFTGVVDAYNANKGLLLYVNIQSANQTLLLKPKLRGLKLLTAVPHTCIPPNLPSNDCRPASGGEPQEAILTNFELKTVAKSSGKGKKRKNFITSPSSCPKGGWKFRADIKYADGTRVKIPAATPCSKR